MIQKRKKDGGYNIYLSAFQIVEKRRAEPQLLHAQPYQI